MMHAYLFAYAALTEVFLGCLAVLCFDKLVKPDWLRPFLPAARNAQRLALPLALAFIPLALGAKRLYAWAAVPGHFSPYLTMPGFWIRGVAYWALWIFLSRRGLREKSGAPALVLLVLTSTFACIDWIMSLSQGFGSTAFGLVFFLGATLLAFGFLSRHCAPGSTPQQRLDQGNVHLALVCTWTYVTFMQFLVIWAGNLPREVEWYEARSTHGWQALPALVALFQFALPFPFLLFRAVKCSERGSRALASASLAMQLLYLAWQILPEAGGFAPEIPALLIGLFVTGTALRWAGKGAHAASARA